MENLTAVDQLQAEVRRRLAEATFTIDAPASSTGSWWVDVRGYGRSASVEWRPERGFGVSGSDGAYGEGADVVVHDPVTAAEHVARLLQPFSQPEPVSREALASAERDDGD
jgi:hypothetical protein